MSDLDKIGKVISKDVEYYVFLDKSGYVWWSQDTDGKTKTNTGQISPIDSRNEEFILSIAREMLESIGR